MKTPNIFSVDVEDYFQVEAFASVVAREHWKDYPCRVEENTKKVLDLLDDVSVKGTFFILGWVADRYPRLVREIVDRGHEPACHSYWHRLIYKLTPDEFRDDTLLAKNCIEQACGQQIYGYRAPSFSIVSKSAWALDVLAELQFTYDSSVFPVKHDTYGVPDAPRTPFQVMTAYGPIIEFPMTTFRMLGNFNCPVGGGGYLRVLPSWYTRFGVNRAVQEGVPVVCYVHPWELDPDQPHIQASLKSTLRHRTNLDKTADRLRDLVKWHHFTNFRESGMLSPNTLPALRL